MEHQGHERRATILSNEQLEAVAERAAELALEKVYASIGKSIVTKALWVAGAGLAALAAWLKGSGKW